MRAFALALLTAVLSLAASAQTAPQRVVLTDGTVIVGVVADADADPVVVIGENGIEQRIPRARIARIEALAAGRFARVDPTRTRLVLSPTGRTLGRQGQVRLGLLSVIIPTATYAVSSRVDVGGAGIVGFGDGLGGVLVPGVKAQVVRAPGVDVALGASAILPISSDSDVNGSFIASPYLAATVGNEVRAATLGVAGFVGGSVDTGDFAAAEGVLISLGGEAQVSNSVKLLGEVIVPIGEGTTGAVVLPGVRFFGDRFAADLFGFVAFGDGDLAGFAPLGSFSYNF